MSKNKFSRTEDHIRILRRSFVGKAMARGMTLSDIQAFLVDNEIFNPNTNEPWSNAIICQDMEFFNSAWKDEALKNISDHRARILAELREIKKSAWAAGKHSTVLNAIDKEVKLLGLNELERLGVEIALANLLKGFPVEIADQLKELLAKKVSERQKKISNKSSKVIDLGRASR